MATADADPASITAVEQEGLPDGDSIEEVLGRITWPPSVHGAAVVVERFVVPPEAERDLPDDPDAALRLLLAHPERQDVRLAVGRAARRHVVVRRAQPRPPTRTSRWPPGRTSPRAWSRPCSPPWPESTRAGWSRRAGRQGVDRGLVVAADRLDRVAGLVQGLDPHHPQAVRDVTDDLVAVAGGGQEPVGAGALERRTSFCWMPPIGPTAPSESIVPVPAIRSPPVISPGVSLSTMPRAKIIPALGPPMSSIRICTWNGNS